MSTIDLAQRVIDCLSREPTSAIVTDVLEEVRQDREKLTTERRETEVKATDPLSIDVDFEKASMRLREIDLLLSRNELQSSRLEAALAEAEAREENNRRLVAYKAAFERMSDAGAALESRYADLASEMRLLFSVCLEAVIDANAVNGSLPAGEAPIQIPEALTGKPEYGVIGGERCILKVHPSLPFTTSLPGFWEVPGNVDHVVALSYRTGQPQTVEAYLLKHNSSK